MKKQILALLIAVAGHASAQIGLSFNNIRPTGEFGFVMKPTLGLEVFYKDFDDDVNFKPRVAIGFSKFTARLDTFPVPGYITSSTTTMTPGYMIYQKYNVSYINIGADYEFRIGDKVILYPGLDVNVALTSVEYQSNYPLIKNYSYSGGTAFIGVRFRAGAQVMLTEKMALFGEAIRHLNFSPEDGGMTYNQYGLGLRYNFKN